MKAFHPTFPNPPPRRPPPKQIFAPHAKTSVSIDYVMSAYEACHTLGNKEEAYASYGVDGQMVEQYLDTVLQLNRILKKN